MHFTNMRKGSVAISYRYILVNAIGVVNDAT